MRLRWRFANLDVRDGVHHRPLSIQLTMFACRRGPVSKRFLVARQMFDVAKIAMECQVCIACPIELHSGIAHMGDSRSSTDTRSMCRCALFSQIQVRTTRRHQRPANNSNTYLEQPRPSSTARTMRKQPVPAISRAIVTARTSDPRNDIEQRKRVQAPMVPQCTYRRHSGTLHSFIHAHREIQP